MEAPHDPTARPASFLQQQPPGATLESHFHRNNQFQVFVDGTGTIGPHAIRPRLDCAYVA